MAKAKDDFKKPLKKNNPLKTVLAKITKPQKNSYKNDVKSPVKKIIHQQKNKTRHDKSTLITKSFIVKASTDLRLKKKPQKTKYVAKSLRNSTQISQTEAGKKDKDISRDTLSASEKSMNKSKSDTKTKNEKEPESFNRSEFSETIDNASEKLGNGSNQLKQALEIDRCSSSKRVNQDTKHSDGFPAVVHGQKEPTMSSPLKSIASSPRGKVSATKAVKCAKESPKKSKPKLVKIRNVKDQSDIKEIKPVPKQTRSRSNLIKTDAVASLNEDISKNELQMKSSDKPTGSSVNITEDSSLNNSPSAKAGSKSTVSKTKARRGPKKQPTEIYKSRHNIGRRSAGRVCSYKETEIALLFPDDYQWSAAKVTCKQDSLSKATSLKGKDDEVDSSDSDDSEVTFPKVKQSLHAGIKSNKPSSKNKSKRTQSLSPRRQPAKENPSRKAAKSLDRKKDDKSVQYGNKSDNEDKKRNLERQDQGDSTGTDNDDQSTSSAKTEAKIGNKKMHKKPISPQMSPSKAKTVHKSRKSRFEDIRPRAYRIQRTACLNANAINSLLYDTANQDRSKPKEDPLPQDKKSVAVKSEKTAEDNEKKAQKKSQDDTRMSTSKQAKKASGCEGSRTTKSSKNKKAVKRKPELPPDLLWPPPKRMASLNAQAIMSACKELDDMKPAKQLKSPKEKSPPKEKKAKLRKSLDASKGDTLKGSTSASKEKNKDSTTTKSAHMFGNEPHSVRFIATSGTSSHLTSQISPQQQHSSVSSPAEQYINVVDDGDSLATAPLASPVVTSQSTLASYAGTTDPSHRNAPINFVSQSHTATGSTNASSSTSAVNQHSHANIVRPKVTTPKPMPQYAAPMQYGPIPPKVPFAHGSSGFRPLYGNQIPSTIAGTVSPAMSQSSYNSTPPSQQYPSPVGFDSSQMIYPRHSSPYKLGPIHPGIQNVPAYPPSGAGPYNKSVYDMPNMTSSTSGLTSQRYDVSVSSGKATSATSMYTQAQNSRPVETSQVGYQSTRPNATSNIYTPVSSVISQATMGPKVGSGYLQAGPMNLQNYPGSSTSYPAAGSAVIGYTRPTFPQPGPAHQGAFVNTGYQILQAGNQRAPNTNVAGQGSQPGAVIQGQPQNFYMSYGYYQPAGPLIPSANPYLTAMRMPHSQLMTHAQPLYAAETKLSPNTKSTHPPIAPKPVSVDVGANKNFANVSHQSPNKQISPAGKIDVLDLTKDTAEVVQRPAYSSVVVTSASIQMSTRVIPHPKGSKDTKADPQKETKDIMDLDSKKVKVHTGAVGEMERPSPLKVPRGLKSTSTGVPPKKPRLSVSPTKQTKAQRGTSNTDKMPTTTKTQAASTTQATPSAGPANVLPQANRGNVTHAPQTSATDLSRPNKTESSTKPSPKAVSGSNKMHLSSPDAKIQSTNNSKPDESREQILQEKTHISSTGANQLPNNPFVMSNKEQSMSQPALSAKPTSHSAMTGAPRLGFARGLMPGVGMPMAGIRPLINPSFQARHVMPGQISMPRFQRAMAVARPLAPAGQPLNIPQRMNKPSTTQSSPKSSPSSSTPQRKRAAGDKSDAEVFPMSKKLSLSSSPKAKGASSKETEVPKGGIGPTVESCIPQETNEAQAKLEKGAKNENIPKPKLSEKNANKKASPKWPKSSEAEKSKPDSSRPKFEQSPKSNKVANSRQKPESTKQNPDSVKTKSKPEAARHRVDSPKTKSESPCQRSDSKSKKQDMTKGPCPKSPSGGAKSQSPKVFPSGSKGQNSNGKSSGAKSPITVPKSGHLTKGTSSSGPVGKKERRRSLEDPKCSGGNGGRRRTPSAPLQTPPSCWQWEGEHELKPCHNLSGELSPGLQKCYPAIRHSDGDIIRVRDCVLVKSGSRKKDLPFVAKIASLWDRQGKMMMNIFWYYRPEQTDTERVPKTEENEIFASRHRDVVPVACIDDKAYVLTFSEYCRYKTQQKQLREGRAPRMEVVPTSEENRNHMPPTDAPADSVFLCRRVYDVKLKRFLKNPQVNSIHSPLASRIQSGASKSPSPKAPTPPTHLDLPSTSPYATRGRGGSTFMPSPMSPDIGFVLHSANLPSFVPRGHVKVLKHDSAASSLDVVLPDQFSSQGSMDFDDVIKADDKKVTNEAEPMDIEEATSKTTGISTVAIKGPSLNEINESKSSEVKDQEVKIVSSTKSNDSVFSAYADTSSSYETQDSNAQLSITQDLKDSSQSFENQTAEETTCKPNGTNEKSIIPAFQVTDTYRFVARSKASVSSTSEINLPPEAIETKPEPLSSVVSKEKEANISSTFGTYKFVPKPMITDVTDAKQSISEEKSPLNEKPDSTISPLKSRHPDAQLSGSNDHVSTDLSNEFITNNEPNLENCIGQNKADTPEDTKNLTKSDEVTSPDSASDNAQAVSLRENTTNVSMQSALSKEQTNTKVNTTEAINTVTEKELDATPGNTSTATETILKDDEMQKSNTIPEANNQFTTSEVKSVAVSFPTSPRKSAHRHKTNAGSPIPKSPRKATKRIDLDMSVDSDMTIPLGGDDEDEDACAAETSYFEALNTSSSTDDSECREDGDAPPEPVITDMTIVEDGSGRIVTQHGCITAAEVSQGHMLCQGLAGSKIKEENTVDGKGADQNKNSKTNTENLTEQNIANDAVDNNDVTESASNDDTKTLVSKDLSKPADVKTTDNGENNFATTKASEADKFNQIEAVIAKISSLSEPTSTSSANNASSNENQALPSLLKGNPSAITTTALPPFETLRPNQNSRTSPLDGAESLQVAPVSPIARSSPICVQEEKKVSETASEARTTVVESCVVVAPDTSSTQALPDSTTNNMNSDSASKGTEQPDSAKTVTSDAAPSSSAITPPVETHTTDTMVNSLVAMDNKRVIAPPVPASPSAGSISRIEQIVNQIKKIGGATSPK